MNELFELFDEFVDPLGGTSAPNRSLGDLAVARRLIGAGRGKGQSHCEGLAGVVFLTLSGKCPGLNCVASTFAAAIESGGDALGHFILLFREGSLSPDSALPRHPPR